MKKIIVLTAIVSTLAISSCRDYKTNGSFLTEKQDAWMNGYSANPEEAKKANKGLVFCRANVKENGRAEPTCYNAKFIKE